MQQTVQKITQSLIDRLPENDQYYRLNELRSWQFPPFIVRRIKVELEKNLAESMIIPKTDWANTQSDAVLDAWQQFVDAIRAEARLPASYAQAVIETAVSDVTEILVQPRKKIPEIVFGNEQELTYDALVDRLKVVVVYPHFATLIKRYMEKKELDSISKNRCSKLITKVDKKLTTRYSPLNWAQMLEPLFDLQDGRIDTNLLRLFFEDKQKPRIAREFDLMDDAVTRAEFIEVLSSPELLNFDGYEDDQSQLFEDQPEKDSTDQDVKYDGSDQQNDETPGENTTKSKLNDHSTSDSTSDLKALSGNPKEDENADKINTDSNNTENKEIEVKEDNSINAAFVEPKDKNEGTEQIEEENEKDQLETESVSDEGTKEEEPLETDESDEDTIAEEEREQKSGEKEINIEKREENSEEETPMWMRYMSEEEIEEYKKQQEDEESETDDDGFIEEPIIDLTNEDASEEEIRKLNEELSGDREFFIEEIFRGSERAFDEALEDIAAYDSWRDVSKYIEKDIFERNLVDMYSEAAVDFTDRLQSYFLEKQNRN